jgi:hypothetical protein
LKTIAGVEKCFEMIINLNDFSKRCYKTCFLIWLVSRKAPIFASLS